MAQNEQRGKSGRGPAAVPPNDPDPREMHAPAPPEEPLRQEAAPGPAAGGGAGGGQAGPEGTGGGGGGGEGGGPVAEPPTEEQLRQQLQEAEDKLKEKEASLAAFLEKKKRKEAADKRVGDYRDQVPALQARQDALGQFRAAEKEFMNEMLPEAVRTAIAAVGGELQAEIDGLAAALAEDEEKLPTERADLEAAKAKAAAAEARLESLAKPASSIGDRLKAAEAMRSETNKAEEAGNYALAYWLVMDKGNIALALEAEPEIIEPEALGAALDAAQAEQEAAQAAIAAGEAGVKQREAAIQTQRAEIAARTKSLDSRTRQRVSELNPHTN